MERLWRKSEFAFTMAVIALYVVGMSVADAVSRTLDLSVSFGIIYAALLSAALVLWARRNGRLSYFGLCRGRRRAADFYWYLPLFLLASCNFWLGIRRITLTVPVLAYMFGMLLIGFLEEFIFRGLLFRVLQRDNLRMAIAVSSLSFGAGHIVNLFNGSGMTLVANLCQVCYAAAAGYLFVTIFYRGGSLWPAIVTHGVINAVSILGRKSETVGEEIWPALVLTVIALTYALALERRLGKGHK